MDPMRRQQYILYFTLFQVMVGMGVVIPILPHFARELGANSVEMGLLITVWAGAQFMFAPVWGALSDRWGRRPLLLIGLSGFAATFLLGSMASTLWMLMLSRFLGGMLSAATIPTAQAYVADTSTGSERTSRMAGMGAAMNLGFICGPAVGGLLSGLGFRGTFLVVGAFGLVNMVLTLFTLPEPTRDKSASGPTRQGFSGVKAVSMALAGPEALLFILAFVNTYGASAMFSMLGFFMADRLGAGPELLAVAFTVEGVSAVLFQLTLVRTLPQRLGPERTVGLALLTGAAGLMIFIAAQNLALVFGGVVLVAFGISTMRPVITAMVSERTRLEQGVTMGIQSAFDALGRSIGPLVAGTVYLWRDWAPFASAAAMYMLFYFISRAAWRQPYGQPSPSD